ncbi:pyridoxine 5'-phosphate synthase [Poriferisphaera sp. WC338]|uniref:pyridoxine 5'-phosphate synthase n=1 Tax=Poriferisphaera sp. WC338 TaxID=3425129 RepID=UPI003D8148AD
MTKLSVNINKVAHLRNTRHLEIPSVVGLARTCLEAGAAGITIHPRPDERHIRATDIPPLCALLNESQYADCEFNIEGNPFEGRYLQHIKASKPDQCTLVPDDPNAFTSNAGWKVSQNLDRLKEIVAELKKYSSRVSLFMDADPDEIALAAQTGADRIELYTEPYADAFGSSNQGAVTTQFTAAAQAASAVGLDINAGHDLNLHNLGHFLTHVPGVLEVSIGHALIADALSLGMTETVKAYLSITNAT